MTDTITEVSEVTDRTGMIDKVRSLREYLQSVGQATDDNNAMLPETRARLCEAGVIKQLQPKDYGGLEGSPVEFFEALMDLAAHSGSTGWVCGVVGVHAFQLASFPRKLQDEVWGEGGSDADVWAASPYAPFGRLVPNADGTYTFSGRWPFSSGCDACTWIILGGLMCDDSGKPIADSPLRHIVLPRSDWDIDQGSWEVVGLKGTGSKDIVIDGAIIPDYRIMDPERLFDHSATEEVGRGDSPLYKMPFHTMFAGCITASTLGICEGVLREYSVYNRERVTVKGFVSSEDPHQLVTYASAAADIHASRLVFLADIQKCWDAVREGREITLEERVEIRRNQVAAARRSLDAADRLVIKAGGNSLRLGHPMQRFWRDAHMAMNHVVNVAEPMYELWARGAFGYEIPASARV